VKTVSPHAVSRADATTWIGTWGDQGADQGVPQAQRHAGGAIVTSISVTASDLIVETLERGSD